MASTYQVKTCIDCNKSFVMHIARKRCDKCKELHEIRLTYFTVCKGCGNYFTTRKLNKKYCTRTCKKDYEHQQYMEKRYGNIPK